MLETAIKDTCSHPQVVRCHDGYVYCQLCSAQTFPLIVANGLCMNSTAIMPKINK
jgi:hypothetical protein|tara:strand:+ start:1144 stop:1308 length:165 start_codon:yes stop_codon:yes gene_type:complete